MPHPLLDSLEQKIRLLLTESATLRLEIAQLEQENARLLRQQQEWETQLGQLLERFDQVNQPLD
ncbi:MAG: cell division protein ZapB [Gammaproteobacteria bacterium]|jgi:FtsZ-binding cell division protein ZapB|nr:cell division protein ZapB [Gammaproteobacteria bacterium]MCP4882051.1 cell division protein ZapB [Gammaproteobacteria bacterium]MDP6165744.1 cell division protein ZapB [Gammaproteobacteria bacterium]